MKRKPKVTVVVPTYNRAQLLDYTLTGLVNQTCKNFEVLIILRPSGDGSKDVIERFYPLLNLELIMQSKGYVTDALNLGIEKSCGEIIAFIDDDAVPSSDWIEAIIETYALENVGGVAGNVLSATIDEKKSILINDHISEIIPELEPFLARIGRKLWSSPIEGMEDYLVYISKAGMVDYNYQIADRAKRQVTKSLLGMGANMSILSEAAEGFKFAKSWVLGLSWEQLLGWHLWKKGYNLFFNPRVIVYHVVHGQTLTRHTKDKKRETLKQIENNLLFFRLSGIENQLSNMHRIAYLAFASLVDLKKLLKEHDTYRTAKIKGRFYSEIIGSKWLLYKSIGSNFSPLIDLERFLR